MRFLANENFPSSAVAALQASGHDVVWIRTAAQGSTDPNVLAWAAREERILLTFNAASAISVPIPNLARPVLTVRRMSCMVQLLTPHAVSRFRLIRLIACKGAPGTVPST